MTGRKISITGADVALSQWYDLFKQMGNIKGGVGVRESNTAGLVSLAVDSDPRRHAILTGGANPYDATFVDPATGGSWSSSGSSFGGVYEANGVTGLGGNVVRLDPSPAGGWRFAWRRKKGASGSTIPGCTCTNIPSTLYQTVTLVDASGTLLPCTYTDQTAPTWLVWPQPTTFLSPQFIEPLTNSTYSYQFYCLVGYYVVRKVYWPDAQFPTGRVGPPLWRYFPSVIFGNSCVPFRMLSGAALSGLPQQIGLKVQE